MKFLLSGVFFIVALSAYGQKYLLPNETNIFSFKTISGKQVVLSKDTANAYIIYRFGSASKVEFEYPADLKTSWKHFKYSFYLRGGGPDNAGMDLNNLYFENNGFRYVIYNNYHAEGNVLETGVFVIDLKTNKKTNIKADIKTRKGTLIDFRDNKLIEIIDEFPDIP